MDSNYMMENNNQIISNRNIKMFNCGFGDCFVINEGTTNFLVDCGGCEKQTKKDLPNILNNVLVSQNNEFSNYLLITHFHRDHYDIIEHLDDKIKFKNIYLRNIYSSSSFVKLTFLNLLLSACSSSRWQEALFSIFALNNLESRLENNGHFIFVKEGDFIQVSGSNYKVLSPFNSRCQNNCNDKELNEIFEKIISSIKDKELKLTLKKIKNDGLNNELEYTDENEGIKDYFIMKIYYLLKKYFNQIEDSILDKKISKAKINNIIVNNELKELITDSRLYLKRKVGNKKIKIFSKIINSKLEHEYNVSFLTKDKEDSSDIKLLMLGDAISSDIDKIIKNNNIHDVFILKAPHHGTDTHVFKGPLCAETVLISHSKYSSYHNIDCFFYHSISKKIYCTNGNNKYKIRKFHNQFNKSQMMDYIEIDF